MTGTDKRGEFVALLGLLLCLVGTAVMAVLGIWSSSSAIWAAAFQTFGACGVWLLNLIQLHQQRLVREERFEVAELERMRREKLGGAQTIFEEEDLGQMEKLAMARRLRSIERALVPTLALLFAAYHLAAGIVVLPWAWQFPPIADAAAGPLLHANIVLFFTGGIAFVCFMLSRYAMGLSRLPDWGVLRAGGDALFGCSASCLAVSIALLCVISGLDWIDVWLSRVIGLLLIFLAVETLINFVLDFYRPRIPGQIQRPFYDSRLLGIFSEPGGILRSVANAVDYQFGFKVSETWFYKLLGRAILPLLLIQVVVIFALTCIVVVPPGHQAVIEHFGTPLSKTAKSGTHLRWFWPVDRVTVIPVERIQRMALGYEEDEETKKGRVSNLPILWTKKHYKQEYQLLVGDRAASVNAKVPVNLLSLNVPLQWRVKHGRDADVIRYHAQSQDAQSIVQSLAYRELTRYAAEADVLDLMGAGGIRAAEDLHDRIQASCDHAGYDGKGIGVEIVYVGIGGVHPPPDEDVAKSYEDVVSAYETKEAKIKEAEGDAASVRIESAGVDWQRCFAAIDAEDKARLYGEAMDGSTQAVERLLRDDPEISGEARRIVAEAVQRTHERVFGELSNAERYESQMLAYQAAPEVYLLRVYLRMLEKGLQDVRKYIVALDETDRVLYELDLKPPQEIDLMAAELGAMESRQSQNQ